MSLLTQLADALANESIKVVDLTAPLGPETPVIGLPPQFRASPGVTMDVISCFDDKGPAWYWNELHLGEHTGTHFDAPVHWITGKDLPDNTCETIPAKRFVGPACVIDVTREVEANEDFLLMPEHVEAWEKRNGRIPKSSWVLLRTGWSQRTNAADFLNVKEDGPHSPGFHQTTSAMLANDREVLGVGVETVGTDAGRAGMFDPPFPNHSTMHGAGRFGLASLRGLEELPETGAIVIAAPLKIVGGSGSPLRVLALVPA
jgi:kynurenine formamidase